MPVSDLSDLSITVSEYIGRADIGAVVNRFVAMAELDIERACTFEDQDAVEVLALTNGRANLPTDFYSARTVSTTSAPTQTIHRVSKHFEREPSSDGILGYTFDGNEIVVFPKSIEEIRLSYLTRLPRLTAAQPVNWLLTMAPDVLLAGTIYHALVWAADDRAGAAKAEFSERMRSALMAEKHRRFTNALIVTAEGLP
jgi:hypothetical protein